jgi:hypothetical protein
MQLIAKETSLFFARKNCRNGKNSSRNMDGKIVDAQKKEFKRCHR